MKAAIVVLSDPKAGTEEAFGRVFNALASAYDYKKRGTPVRVLFQGAGTRWVGELTKAEHPAHALFEEVRDTVEGVSSACTAAFGATEAATSHGFGLLTDNQVPADRISHLKVPPMMGDPQLCWLGLVLETGYYSGVANGSPLDFAERQ